MPNDGDMLGLLAGWADAPTRDLILRDNPAAPHGF